MSRLDRAFDAVLAHPHFASFSREDLLLCPTFCAAVRTAPHEALVALQRDLEEIAFATDDHNEASGVLLLTTTLGGGLQGVTARGDLPVGDPTAFAELVISTPHEDRAALALEVTDARLRHLASLDRRIHPGRAVPAAPVGLLRVPARRRAR